MMAEVRKRFLPRFIGVARERIRLGREIAARATSNSRDQRHASQADDALHIARELHSLAGEAGLLGLDELLALARRAEEEATQLHASVIQASVIHASRTDARRTALEQALSDLELAVGTIEQQLRLEQPTKAG